MGVERPDWWSRYYPERCSNGHDWAPGKIIVSWMLCDCPPAQAAQAARPSRARGRAVRNTPLPISLVQAAARAQGRVRLGRPPGGRDSRVGQLGPVTRLKG